jgi:exodeoxyribonuclease VII small subunit
MPGPAETTTTTTERFDELLARLRALVDRLESGNLPLEESLRSFEEGMELCRRGAAILDGAEKKVELLLGGSPAAPRTAPFETPQGD